MMNSQEQKMLLPTLSKDDSLFMIQRKKDVKRNTPEMERKNLFGVAKTTVDKMKNTVRVKRQEIINMMYNSQEAACTIAAEKYKLQHSSHLMRYFN